MQQTHLIRDPRGFPTQVTSRLLDPATGTPATATNLYTYDANGWLTSECTPATGTTCASTSPQTAYTYDSAGVRKTTAVTRLSGTTPQTTTTAYGYDTADQLLTLKVGTTTDTTNTWTTDGQIATTTTSAGTRTYDTDLAGEVATVTLEDDRTIGYSYDPTGNRTARTTNGVIDTSWAWDDLTGLSMRIGEYDVAGVLTTSWLPDPTSSTGATYAATAAGTSSWLLQDPYADTIATLPTTGSVTGARTQAVDAFGNPITTTTPVGPVGFAGQYKDAATGLYDVRARDYDTHTGQFLSIDPFVDKTRQPYAYGNNNPLAYIDPSGNSPDEIWKGALGVGQGVGDALTPMMIMLYGGVFGQVYIGYLQIHEMADMYDEGGGGGWGTAYAAASINPVYHGLDSFQRGSDLAHAGCTQESARAFTGSAIAFGSTAAIAFGGAGAGVKAWSGRPNYLRGDLGAADFTAEPHVSLGLPPGYSSFGAAKRALGSPGPGNVFDHIVEQSQAKATRSGFPVEDINSPFNLNPISAAANQKKANFYASIQPESAPLTVRNWLNGKSFEFQYEYGADISARIQRGEIP